MACDYVAECNGQSRPFEFALRRYSDGPTDFQSSPVKLVSKWKCIVHSSLKGFETSTLQ